jgi:hypothetical protein
MSFIVGVIHVMGRREPISVTSVCGHRRSEDKSVSLRACCGHDLCSGQTYVLLFGGGGGYGQIPCNMILIWVTKSRSIRWTGHVAPTGEKSYMYRVLLRQSKGNKPLGRYRSRWRALTGFALFRIGASEGLL